MKILRFTLLLAALGGALYIASDTSVLNSFEKHPPEILIGQMPTGIGGNSSPLSLTIRDSGAGVAKVDVHLQQGDKTLAIPLAISSDPQHEVLITTEIPILKGTFIEAPAQLVVAAEDASIWANKIEQRFDFNIDFSKPRLSLLTLQHIGSQGGAEFVLLEAKDTNLAKVGVRVGEVEFPAVPASQLDPAFEGTNIFASLFALPLEYGDSPTIRGFARDTVDNETTIGISFRIKPYRQAQVSPKISASFVENKVRPLYDEFIQEMSSRGKTVASSEDLNEIFRTVNEQSRQLLQDRLAKLDRNRKAFSRGAHIKPMPSATSSTFGELRTYLLDGVEAGGSRHDGLDLASVRQDAVFASHDGTVILAEPFGIYGLAVVIDHGLYLTSLYGHLSSISVEAGDEVKQGQEVGRSGETGLAGGDHLHFEYRVMNTPVDPREWWDSNWIEDNIDGKLQAVKESLGLTATQSEKS